VQLLQLLTFTAWRASPIVLLDEPDSHLHTTLQMRLFEFLKEMSDVMNVQVILASHSRDLIARAPIECIIPVDSTREQLKPLETMEHLLLEYQRHGCISNLDVALLYRTRRCLFVEGPSDIEYLPAFAERLGITCFKGLNQVVMFEFKGAGKFTMVADLAELLERLVGAHISWMVLRDRDYSIPLVVSAYEDQARQKRVSNFHIWQRFSIENYLLDPDNLLASLRGKLGPDRVNEVDRGSIEGVILEAGATLSSEVQANYVDGTQTAFMRYELVDSNPREGGTLAAVEHWRGIGSDTVSGIVDNFPGDKVFGRVVGIIQRRYGITLSPMEVITYMTGESVPPEVKEFLTNVAVLPDAGPVTS